MCKVLIKVISGSARKDKKVITVTSKSYNFKLSNMEMDVITPDNEGV